jgi:membrane protein implicated in regulation of membrane protease activity
MDKNHVLKAVFSPVAAGWFVPDWFWWLLLLLVLIFLLLLILLYLRRRRKKTEEAFRSGWTAWYYCYDLRKNR